MNTFQRGWLTWKHARKFARAGKGCRFPIPAMTVEGHVEVGERCRFRNNVTLRAIGEGRIVFAGRSGCSWGVLIESRSRIEIGSYSGIAEYCVLSDALPRLSGNSMAAHAAECHAAPIIIGENCFIGSGCFVGPGVTIGDSAVIAPHSVVTRSVGPFEIWGGVPARRIAHRTKGVPESKLREMEALVAQQGFQMDRYIE